MNFRFNMVEGYMIHYMYRGKHDNKACCQNVNYYTENVNDDMMDIELLDSNNLIIVKAIVSCKFNREMLHRCEYH